MRPRDELFMLSRVLILVYIFLVASQRGLLTAK